MTDPTYRVYALAGMSPDQTQDIVDQLARQYGAAPSMRRITVEICRAMGASPSDPEQIARAIQRWIQTQVQFAREAGEQILTPARTLLWRLGDCDDLTALAGACLLSLGVPYRSEVLLSPPHIWPQARVGGRWIHIEVSDPRVQFGEHPTAFLGRIRSGAAFAG